MRIFLAGVNPTDSQQGKIFLAGVNPYPEDTQNSMKIFLADGFNSRIQSEIGKYPVCVLESFYYANAGTEELIPKCKDFLLDSGAFTFIQGKHKGPIDWEEYVEKYAAFIIKNNVEKFFELDIDSVVGYARVLELRKLLERLSQKKCIPVWHLARGMDEFLKMCDEYDYVAIGGIALGEIARTNYHIFPYLIQEAHRRKAKIHGLGFTNLRELKRYHFDSVDSTAWLSGNRFGVHYLFNGKELIKKTKPQNTRLADQKATCCHNFFEWIKFANWAETHY